MKKLTIVLSDDMATQIIQLLTSRDVVSVAIENAGNKPTRLVRRGGKTVPKHLSDHFSQNGYFDLGRASNFLTSLGYNGTTAASALSELASAGYIERSPEGRFKFIKAFP